MTLAMFPAMTSPLNPNSALIPVTSPAASPARTSIDPRDPTIEYREPMIERFGPPLLRALAIASGIAILTPALIALVGPLFA